MDLTALQDNLRNMGLHHARGESEAAAVAMINMLVELENKPIGITDGEKRLMGRAILQFATLFCQPDFQIPPGLAFALLQHNCLISNLFAGCLGMTTDPFIELVRGDPGELYKTLVLYSGRNEAQVDIAKAMQINPSLVSQWLYQSWKMNPTMMGSKKITGAMTHFLDQVNSQIQPAVDLNQLYFGCTYLGNDRERRIKEILNQSIQRYATRVIRNNPNPKKIGVFSDHLWKGHSVYRTLIHYIRSLKEQGGYHLTLMHAHPIPEKHRDTEVFDEVITFPWDGANLDISAIASNEFAALVMPDVGMSLPSIIVANHRIAPVQVAMTGHPSSSFGACVDYFISGKQVDLPPQAHLTYGERLVMLPGYGAVHEKPTYQKRHPSKRTDHLVVNGSWSGPKVHWSFLGALSQVIEGSMRPLLFRIFSSAGPLRHKGGLPFIQQVDKQLPGCKKEVFGHLDYDEYMGLLEEADFALDCFPFGGSNTVSDMLYLGIPVLCREGTRWFNRIGPAMLRSIGLDELIATTDSEYIKKAIRLANDEEYRSHLSGRIAAADLDTNVYTPRGASEFRGFIDRVVANPRAYPGYEPIDLS